MQGTVLEQVVINGRTLPASNTLSGEAGTPLEAVISDNSTDKVVSWTLDVSQVAMVYILSDQDITLETNDGSTPDDTLALKAGIPYVWYTDKYDSLIFTADVSILYVTNASGEDATLQIETLYDATP